MKIARVIPIFKSGDAQEFSNYRPVSILPQFSKILEKLFRNRLMSFLNDKQILYNGQFGFRKNHSTSMAILELVEEMTTAMDNSQSSIAVFIDLKKAFDTVDHNILLKKLENYGITGLAYSWIHSYQNNRRQYVSINGTNSTCLNIACGVPQGPILGPILLYTDHQLDWTDHIKRIKNKIARNVSVMNRVKHLLNSHALHSLYCTLIMPYLNYCCEAWGNTYKNRINPLHMLQKKATRICKHEGYLSHTRPIFLYFKILCVYDMIDYNNMVFMFKAHNNLLPLREYVIVTITIIAIKTTITK